MKFKEIIAYLYAHKDEAMDFKITTSELSAYQLTLSKMEFACMAKAAQIAGIFTGEDHRSPSFTQVYRYLAFKLGYTPSALPNRDLANYLEQTRRTGHSILDDMWKETHFPAIRELRNQVHKGVKWDD